MNDEICAFCPTYMDVEAIETTSIRNLEFGIHKIYYVDGPFVGFSKQPQSTDGTRHFISTLGDKAMLIDAGISFEYTKFNLAAHQAMRDGYKYMIILGSDEWLTGDINKAKQIMNDNYRESSMMYDINIKEYQPNKKYNRVITRLTKIFVNPAWIRARDIHWFYFMNGSETPVLAPCPLLPITLHHDDAVRSDRRNEEMEKWQDKEVKREDKIIKNKYLKKILDADYPPVKGLHGMLYWTCGCIKKDDVFTKLCETHKGREFVLKY